MCHFSFHNFFLSFCLSSLNDFDISSTISPFAKIYIFSLISLLCLFIPHMLLTLRSTLSHCFSFSSCFSRTDTITDYCMHSVSGDGAKKGEILLSCFIMSIGWKWWALWILWTQFCFYIFFLSHLFTEIHMISISSLLHLTSRSST